jgi:hypothetical protein
MENVQQVKDRDKLFLEKAHKACVKSGKAYEFECPILQRICHWYEKQRKRSYRGQLFGMQNAGQAMKNRLMLFSLSSEL